MKGLLKKDFYSVLAQNPIVYGFLVLILMINAMSANNAIVLFTIGPMLVLSFSSGRFTLDRTEGWSTLPSFLPVSAKKTVLARYLFAFITVMLTTLAMPLLYLIILRLDPAVHMAHAWSVMLAIQVGSWFLVMLVLPLLYRFQSNTLAMAMAFIAMIPILLIVFFAVAIKNMEPILAPLRFIAAHSGLASLVFLVLLLCVTCVSYLLSVHFYKRKHD